MQVGNRIYGCEWAASVVDELDETTFRLINELCASSEQPISILDIGGGTGAFAKNAVEACPFIGKIHILDMGDNYGSISERNAEIGRNVLSFQQGDLRQCLRDTLTQEPWSIIHVRRVVHFLEEEQELPLFLDDLAQWAPRNSLIIMSFECIPPEDKRDLSLSYRNTAPLDSRDPDGNLWVPVIPQDGEKILKTLVQRGFAADDSSLSIRKQRRNYICELIVRAPEEYNPEPVLGRPRPLNPSTLHS